MPKVRVGAGFQRAVAPPPAGTARGRGASAAQLVPPLDATSVHVHLVTWNGGAGEAPPAELVRWCGEALPASEAATLGFRRGADGPGAAAGVLRATSRGFARRVLGRYAGLPPGSLAFALGAAGKPRLVGLDEGRLLCFNVSHTGCAVGVAVSASRPVGLDLENLSRLEGQTARALRLAKRWFSPVEAAAAGRAAAAEAEAVAGRVAGEEASASDHAGAPGGTGAARAVGGSDGAVRVDARPPPATFLVSSLWTLKEALVKCTGRGIAAGPGLRGFSFGLPEGATRPPGRLARSPDASLPSRDLPACSPFPISLAPAPEDATSAWDFVLASPVEDLLGAICVRTGTDGGVDGAGPAAGKSPGRETASPPLAPPGLSVSFFLHNHEAPDLFSSIPPRVIGRGAYRPSRA